jgi:DNA topoisomerase-2
MNVRIASASTRLAHSLASYHHGEVSLHGTIVNLAQDYVGANNVPLLVPAGQFGTRHARVQFKAWRRFFRYFTC